VGGRAEAQEVTGSIQGIFVSAEAGPEPEISVTLTGPHLQGTRQTQTDRRGFFQFVAVPPGTYRLRAERIGLQPMEIVDVVVELGRTTSLPTQTMTLQPLTESVVVRVPPIAIDTVDTAMGGTLDAIDYASLPVERDYRSILAILPHANVSYRGDPVNVGGSTGLENQYHIDGVNVTDTRDASRATSLPYNFVRAVEVKTGAYEAQFGRALGAVVNAVTYSGTNDFAMNGFVFAQPGNFSSEPRATALGAEQVGDSYDLGVRVGGPMIRDRLWYSAAVNPRADQTDKEISGFGSFTDSTKALLFAGKLTWQASPSTNLELSVFGDPTTRDQVKPLPSGITSVTNPDPLLIQLDSGGTTASLRATVTPSPSALLEFSLARQWDRYTSAGATPVGRSEKRYLDWVEASIGGGVETQWDEKRGRTSLTARGTFVVPGHTLVAGLDYEDAEVYSAFTYQNINRLGDTIYEHSLESYEGTFHNRSPALYVQDNWRITDRFTLSPGLRWSGQYLVGASGNVDQRITDEWQPRLGFSWQLGQAGRQRLFGSYGRFYQTLPTNIAVVFLVDFLAVYSYYSSDPRQPGVVPDYVIDGSTLESDYATQIPGLQADNFDEFTLGYERLLGANSKLTVRAIRRNLRSSFQFGIDYSQDPIFVLGTPGKGNFDFLPPPEREYTALEVAAEGMWGGGSYRASYVLSRTWGNYPGLFNSDFGFANPGQVTTFFMPGQGENSTGYLPNDRTHVVKLSGSYATRFGLGVGTVFTFETGTPINDFAAGSSGPFFPTFVAPRGSAGRTPSLWDLNVRLTYNFPIARRWQMQAVLDLLHVGNPRRAVWVDESHYLTLDENGNPGSPNPNYKQPIAYQPPMAARLGLEVNF
jgi:hypothetical protein